MVRTSWPARWIARVVAETRISPGAVEAVHHNRLRTSGSRGKQTANTLNPTVLD
jgi:hypothetical protein